MVSARKTVVGLPDSFSWTIFPLHHVYDENIYPRVCVRATRVMSWFSSSRLDVLVLDVSSIEVFVHRRLFHSFLGVLTPSNLERARINFGSYCLKSRTTDGQNYRFEVNHNDHRKNAQMQRKRKACRYVGNTRKGLRRVSGQTRIGYSEESRDEFC